MKNNFDLETKKILKEAENEMFSLNHPYVGSEHMLLGILKINTELKELFKSYNLTYSNFKTELIRLVGTSRKKSEIALYTPLLKRIITGAEEEAEESNTQVKPEHLILSMLEEGEGIAIRIMLNMNINIEGIYSDILKSSSPDKKNKNSILLEIGKQILPNPKERIYKRDKEIEQLIEILLRKNKNNPLLLGEAGVGKTAIVEEFARLIEEDKVPTSLQGFKIIEMDTGSIISGTRYRGEFEDRLHKIIKEAIDEKNIILFIDEIHTLVNCGGAEGAVDAANILKPYLARGELKIIGATTLKEYKETIYKDKALDRRFQIINVEEPSLEDTKYILKNIKSNYENHHHVKITEENIKDILNYSQKYIHNRYNPDKSIDILDSVCAHAQMNQPPRKEELIKLNKLKVEFLNSKNYKEAINLELKIKEIEEKPYNAKITREDILKIIEKKANMPLANTIQKKLSTLSDILKKDIFGQNSAIEDIVEALKEKYINEFEKPLCIMLSGPSGVGKSLLASKIGQNFFGENSTLKLDANELSGDMAINKLLGTAQGYVGYNDETILSKIKDHPCSLIIIDEIEKTSQKIQNLFTEILENGRIRNSRGETIHFENTTIIMTSTAKKTCSVGFNSRNKIDLPSSIEKNLSNQIQKHIMFKPIERKTAEIYIKTILKSKKLTKKEIDTIISKSNIEKNGLRTVNKELNRYKINKLLTKV